ncbi:DUF3693 domain-containing protein [Xylella fastidiosa subsp. sandyi]|uniref:DUF3693 domain-containing protein n=1 Tax=Xylella fastidiosa TaxID=2371 RepID=UPI000FFE7751|nr:DUF3693 domain-containing protein [Xylella fastidiosa]RWA43689.1 hypothetical protein XfCFBP8356_10515 [Xylella fastidiosa subsp. sandyi]
MDINLLLDKAKEACFVKYDKDLALKLKIKATSISNYRKGISLPDTTVCAELADITGLPLTKVLGIVGEARAISKEEKAVWRRLATIIGTTLMIGTGMTCPNTFQAQSISEKFSNENLHNAYYVHVEKMGARTAV